LLIRRFRPVETEREEEKTGEYLGGERDIASWLFAYSHGGK